jgi:hypothetical protein
VPRVFKQDRWSSELVVRQSVAGKNVNTEAEDIVEVRRFILFRNCQTVVLKSTIVGIFGTNTGTDPFESYMTSVRKGTETVTHFLPL